MPTALTTAIGEFDGTDLVSYAFKSMPGVGIQTGAPITGHAPVQDILSRVP